MRKSGRLVCLADSLVIHVTVFKRFQIVVFVDFVLKDLGKGYRLSFWNRAVNYFKRVFSRSFCHFILTV